MQIHSHPVFTTQTGSSIEAITLKNQQGLEVEVLTWGATLAACRFPDRNGRSGNVILGFPEAGGFEQNGPYFGAICGRFANRIARGQFTLDGASYQLATNNPPNHLHGGTTGFNRQPWSVVEDFQSSDQVGVTLQHVSPHLDEGFPGELTVRVTYLIDQKNRLELRYEATCNQPTVLNLTNHAYWNLGGTTPTASSVLEHQIELHCDGFLMVDETQIPVGTIEDVTGTAMDFRTSRPIREVFHEIPGGLDHCFVIRGDSSDCRLAAIVTEPESGRQMSVFTTEPGIQLYTGNFLDGSDSCAGYDAQSALCLECQHFPDAPNQPQFPSTRLNPGEMYRQKTIHQFELI